MSLISAFNGINHSPTLFLHRKTFNTLLFQQMCFRRFHWWIHTPFFNPRLQWLADVPLLSLSSCKTLLHIVLILLWVFKAAAEGVRSSLAILDYFPLKSLRTTKLSLLTNASLKTDFCIKDRYSLPGKKRITKQPLLNTNKLIQAGVFSHYTAARLWKRGKSSGVRKRSAQAVGEGYWFWHFGICEKEPTLSEVIVYMGECRVWKSSREGETA